MKKLSVAAAVFLAAGLLALPVLAQEAKKAEPPKPAPSLSQGVLEQWNDIGRRLIAIAEDLPENKYGYKPHPDSRSFVSQLIHAGAGMYFFTDGAEGNKARYGDGPKDEPKTKAEVVAFVKKCVEDGAAVIKAKGDKGMMESVVNPYSGNYDRVLDLAYGLIEHSGEHYGQLVVYYRINGQVPPESRPKPKQ
jgi:hypothetical protein